MDLYTLLSFSSHRNTQWGTPSDSNIVEARMVAKFDYEGRTLGELSIKKGEQLEVGMTEEEEEEGGVI